MTHTRQTACRYIITRPLNYQMSAFSGDSYIKRLISKTLNAPSFQVNEMSNKQTNKRTATRHNKWSRYRFWQINLQIKGGMDLQEARHPYEEKFELRQDVPRHRPPHKIRPKHRAPVNDALPATGFTLDQSLSYVRAFFPAIAWTLTQGLRCAA